MLSQSDTRAIQQMRNMLHEWDSMSVRQATTTHDPVMSFQWGRFAEACNTARDALHEVLSVADSYLDDVHAAAALREGR
jgi:hypothetical protein